MLISYFVILSLYLKSVLSDEKPSPPLIVKEPPNGELFFDVSEPNKEFHPVILPCEAEGIPTPRYFWHKNGKPFNWQTYDDRISMQPGRGSLLITKPLLEDRGKYQCFAKNIHGTAASNSVFLYPITFDFCKTSATVSVSGKKGQPIKLPCQPSKGYPQPKVKWVYLYNSGTIQTINSSRMTVDPEGSLWFSNLTDRDNSKGQFYHVCAALSAEGGEYKICNRISLNVESEGSFKVFRQEPVKQYVSKKVEVGLLGKSMELFCIYGGTPLPQIVWNKNGRFLYSSDRIMLGNYGKSLIIKSVDFDDEGTYNCEASNGVGSAQSYSMSLKVVARPYFLMRPKSQHAAIGDTVELKCKAGGVPEPQIKWIYNGKPIEDALPNPRRKVSNNTIIIEYLRRTDTGNYGCKATNSLGYVYEDVYVNVIANTAPEITKPPKDVTAIEKQNVKLSCKTFGVPKPAVKWFRDGQELTRYNHQINPDGTLLIKDVSFRDSGTFSCEASNKLGVAKAFATLKVKAPTRIINGPDDLDTIVGSSATFRCQAVADSELNLEIIWFRNNNPIDFKNDIRFTISADNSLVISKTTELDSGTYTCLAQTELDNARATSNLIVSSVPNAPKLISVKCSYNNANITWIPYSDNRLPILYYIIQYSTQFFPNEWKDLITISASERIPLAPWNQYYFRIKSVNKIGQSAPSEPSQDICITPPGAPKKNPSSVNVTGIQPDNLVITWDPLPKTEYPGTGFKYRVCFKQNVDGATYNCTDIDNYRQNQYVVQHQPKNQQYKIKVIASNDYGDADEEPKEAIGYSGTSRPLLAPTNFTLYAVLDGRTALLTWDHVPKESIRGGFLGYKIITWSDVSNLTKEILVQGDSTQALINKFDPFTRNYARICVFNSMFNGPSSETLLFDMPEGKPDVVETLEAYPLGLRSLLVKWIPPTRTNGRLTGYIISWNKVNNLLLAVDPLNTKTILDPKITTTKLTNLLPDTRYRIYVSATTKVGESQKYFIEKKTNQVESLTPSKPTFKWTLIERNSRITIRIRWQPAEDGNGGANFMAKCRKNNDVVWLKSNIETQSDWVDIDGLTDSGVYNCLVVSLDEPSVNMMNSEIQEIDISKEKMRHNILIEEGIRSENNQEMHRTHPSKNISTSTITPTTEDYDY